MPKFQRGTVPNPNGRPKGTGHKQRLFAAVVQPEGEKVIRRALEKALEGDAKLLSAFMDRLLPKSYDDIATTVDMPDSMSINDLKPFAMSVLKLVNSQEITLEEAQRWLELLRSYRESVLIEEINEAAKAITEQHKELKASLIIEGMRE